MSMFKNTILFAFLLTALVYAVSCETVSGIQSVAEPPPAVPTTPRAVPLELLLRSAIGRKSRLDDELAVLNKKIQEVISVREDFMEVQDRLGFSMESFAGMVGSLQTQRVELMIDLAGLDARREALQKVAESGSAGNNDGEKVSLLQEMETLSKLKYERTEALFHKASIAESTMFDAKREYFEARLRLLDAIGSGGKNENAMVAPALVAISLDRAEKQARLEKITMLLEQLTSERRQVFALEDLSRKHEMYIDRANSVQNEIDGVEVQILTTESMIEQQQMLQNRDK